MSRTQLIKTLVGWYFGTQCCFDCMDERHPNGNEENKDWTIASPVYRDFRSKVVWEKVNLGNHAISGTLQANTNASISRMGH